MYTYLKQSRKQDKQFGDTSTLQDSFEVQSSRYRKSCIQQANISLTLSLIT